MSKAILPPRRNNRGNDRPRRARCQSDSRPQKPLTTKYTKDTKFRVFFFVSSVYSVVHNLRFNRFPVAPQPSRPRHQPRFGLSAYSDGSKFDSLRRSFGACRLTDQFRFRSRNRKKRSSSWRSCLVFDRRRRAWQIEFTRKDLVKQPGIQNPAGVSSYCCTTQTVIIK